MEAVYRDTRGGVERHRRLASRRVRVLPADGGRGRAHRRVRDRRPSAVLRRAAGGDRRARLRACLHRHPCRRRRPRRGEHRADRARGSRPAAMSTVTGREVQLVRYPQGEVTRDDFAIVERPVPSPLGGTGARPQHVDVRRPGPAGAPPREGPGGVFRRLPPRGADGRDHDDRRGRRVAGRGVRARRHRLAFLRLARLRRRHRRRGGAPRHRHPPPPRRGRLPAAGVPRRARRERAHGLRRAAARVGPS